MNTHGERLSCEILDTSNPDNKIQIHNIKKIYIESLLEEGIIGFSEEIDNIFDPFSYYFVSKVDDEILCFVRIIFKTPKNKLPLEMGTIVGKDYGHTIKEDRFVELTTFWAKDFYAFELLSRKAIEFVYNMGVVKVYSTKELGEKN